MSDSGSPESFGVGSLKTDSPLLLMCLRSTTPLVPRTDLWSFLFFGVHPSWTPKGRTLRRLTSHRRSRRLVNPEVINNIRLSGWDLKGIWVVRHLSFSVKTSTYSGTRSREEGRKRRNPLLTHTWCLRTKVLEKSEFLHYQKYYFPVNSLRNIHGDTVDRHNCRVRL